jgi:hypothetical protein
MPRRRTGAKITQAKDHSELQVVQQEEDTPLPPAEELEKLKAINPELISTTIEMIRVENKFRRTSKIRADIFVFIERILALFIVLAITGGAFYASYLLAMSDHETTACVVSGGALAMIISAILKRR